MTHSVLGTVGREACHEKSVCADRALWLTLGDAASRRGPSYVTWSSGPCGIWPRLKSDCCFLDLEGAASCLTHVDQERHQYSSLKWAVTLLPTGQTHRQVELGTFCSKISCLETGERSPQNNKNNVLHGSVQRQEEASIWSPVLRVL